MPSLKCSFKSPRYDTGDPVYEEIEDDQTFSIGQAYEYRAAASLGCVKCGGREFNVGKGHCFTAIRCPTCGWEVCVHEG